MQVLEHFRCRSWMPEEDVRAIMSRPLGPQSLGPASIDVLFMHNNLAHALSTISSRPAPAGLS